ncbi:MAG: CapA family protein [Bacteroidia bacterium]
MRTLLLIVLVIVAICGAWIGLKQKAASQSAEAVTQTIESEIQNQESIAEVVEETPASISMIGVGDIMTGTNYPSARYLPPNGGKDLLNPVRDILTNADITFGNLEGTVLNSGGSAKRCSDPSKCYVFRMPESHVQHFVNTGFDFMSIANNHSGDMGAIGRKNTIRVLTENGISCAGLLTHPTAQFEQEGVKYGFIAFAPNSGTLNVRDIPDATARVRKLAAEVDIVIVSFHGGAEGTQAEHVPRKTETYYGENRGNVYKFAHAMIDAGADIIWGHGPHVVRGIELYKDRLITYSLGNFCTYARFSLRGVKAYAPIVKAELATDGTFLSGNIHSFIQKGEGGPVADPNNSALKRIKMLSNADFPESPLKIGDDGSLVKE